MSICFGQEFNITRCSQFLEAVDYFRRLNLHLFQSQTGNRECNFKFASTCFDHFQNCLISRQVAAFSYAAHNFFVLEVIIVIMVASNIKETVSFQAEG